MQYRSPVSLRPLLLAAGMLTAVRAPLRAKGTEEELRSATAFYPLVGLGIGLLPAAVLLAPLPSLMGAVLALAVWTVAAGASLLDGWAHCCDAAFAPPLEEEEATRQRRLAILRDPRVGVFGVAGVALLLLAKWSALVYAPPLAPLVAAPVARWTLVHTLRAHPPPRRDG
ncbi:MAG TPA: adenosylcobinamide-GDP ribazoletransferase, partial [Longimicrobiaceae bacterium]|nr:adenosylcobinamide-GDP ribazoletransferase [Longimicrobiaceae bacterium]